MQPGRYRCHDDVMPETILIVDDHAGFRRAARAMLQSEGFDVVGEAADGVKALAEVVRLGPDIMLLDIQLPGIDGFAVADRLAVRGGGPAVILISSRDPAEYGGKVEASPTRGFIAKSQLTGAAIRALTG
jgi:DNA-binding NarL/FixJ family response regulator